jgi:hypothetical protein
MKSGKDRLIATLSGTLMAVTLCCQLPLASQADDAAELMPESASMDAARSDQQETAPSSQTMTLYGSARKRHASLDATGVTSAEQNPLQDLSATDNAGKLQSEQASNDTSKMPLQGQLVKRALGVRSLPEGMEPDVIIGHFSMSFGFIHIGVNGPIGNEAQFSSKLEKEWRGKQVRSCELHLDKIKDGSGGYYFNTIGHRDGPRGWLMPMPKPANDKTTPWAIYFDQPDTIASGERTP